MSDRHEHAPKGVYLLADSLDSILAACEDLTGKPPPEPSSLLRLELAAITHVLQARRYVRELDAAEPALSDQFVLFLAATAALDHEQLLSGRPLTFQEPAASPVADTYMIGQQMPLGVLALIAATMLDALEAHYVLYDGDSGRAIDNPPAAMAA